MLGTIDDDRERWFDGLISDTQNVVDGLQGDRLAVAIGYIALYWVTIALGTVSGV